MRILILCTGNSCRSQMAEGFLRSLNPSWNVHSAGTKPASQVHPKAIAVMREIGIDLSAHKPKLVDQFLDQAFDYVITVCDHAKDTCPVFLGKVQHRVHIGFDDPAKVEGSDDFVLQQFRRIRDEIEKQFKTFAARVSP